MEQNEVDCVAKLKSSKKKNRTQPDDSQTAKTAYINLLRKVR